MCFRIISPVMGWVGKRLEQRQRNSLGNSFLGLLRRRPQGEEIVWQNMKHWGMPTCWGREIKEEKENTILYVVLLEIKAAAESKEK